MADVDRLDKYWILLLQNGKLLYNINYKINKVWYNLKRQQAG